MEDIPVLEGEVLVYNLLIGNSYYWYVHTAEEIGRKPKQCKRYWRQKEHSIPSLQ